VEKRKLLHPDGRNSAATVGNSMEFSQKKTKTELSYDPVIPLLGIYVKKKKHTNSKRYNRPNIHSSFIYGCQDMEAT